MMKQIERENEQKRIQVEAQREQLKKNISATNNDSEKQRLMGQLDQFENAIQA